MASTFRERRFPPSEVRRILRSAARIAETDPGTGVSGSGGIAHRGETK